MATARLRKAFKYPEEDEGEGPADGIDEEEQEKLIARLSAEDRDQTVFYTRLFAALPVVTSLVYLPSLVAPSGFLNWLHTVAALFSFGLTLFCLFFVQPSFDTIGATRAFLQDVGLLDEGKGKAKARSTQEKRNENVQLGVLVGNAAISAITALSALEAENTGRKLKGMLPGVVYILILIARAALRPIDMSELEKSRYRYKGA